MTSESRPNARVEGPAAGTECARPAHSDERAGRALHQGADPVRSNAFLGRVELTHSKLVSRADRAQLVGRERHQGLRVTGSSHELDFDVVRRVNMHHRAHIAALQSVLRQITKHHCCVQ